ncbi:MAG TPA: TonB family protein, partial [Bryobacteraceae bacterium]|nr:TonB family protein [Bryobacteraceae bacterium]
AKAAPAPPKREDKQPVQPLPFKRDERPAITPQAKVDARPAGPMLVKKEEAVAPKPEEKPAIQPVAKREEKAPAPPVRGTPDAVSSKEPEVKAAAVKAEPAPAPKADLPKVERPKPEEFSPLSATSEPANPGIFANKWIWIGLIVVLLCGGAAYKFLFSGKPAQESAQADALSLRVERNAGQLLLTWNRNASAIQTASRATLTINDGDHREDADLDLGLLRSGNVVYTPMTNDVSFRLEVTDVKGGKSVSESMRVLAGRPSPAPVDQQATSQQTAQAPQKLTAVPAAEMPAAAKPVEQVAATPAPAAQSPKAEVMATPVVTAQPPKPESLAARLSAPPSISEPPSLDLQGSTPIGGSMAIPSSITAAAPPPAVPAQSASPQAARQTTATAAPPKIGGMVQDARLIKREMPVYPGLARNARVSGTVRVEALIGPDGKVRSARALQGPPLLRQAAADAVKKWVYQPAMLNGQPTESTTQIDLLFSPSSR